MATKESIAITRELAIKALKESGEVIAQKLGIALPEFTYYRDKDLQQAEELKTLAAFNQSVLEALEGMSNGEPTAAKTKQSGR